MKGFVNCLPLIYVLLAMTQGSKFSSLSSAKNSMAPDGFQILSIAVANKPSRKSHISPQEVLLSGKIQLHDVVMTLVTEFRDDSYIHLATLCNGTVKK